MRSLQRLSHLTQRGDASKASAPTEPVAQHRNEAEFWEGESDPSETAEWLQLLDGGRTDDVGAPSDSSEMEEYDWAAPMPEPDTEDSWAAPVALDAEPPSTEAGFAPSADDPFDDGLPGDVPVDDAPLVDAPIVETPVVETPVIAAAFEAPPFEKPPVQKPTVASPFARPAPVEPANLHAEPIEPEVSHLQIVEPAVARFEMIETEPVAPAPVEPDPSHLQIVEPQTVEPQTVEPVTRFEIVRPEIADLMVRDPAPDDLDAPPPAAGEFLPTIVDDLLPPR